MNASEGVKQSPIAGKSVHQIIRCALSWRGLQIAGPLWPLTDWGRLIALSKSVSQKAAPSAVALLDISCCDNCCSGSYACMRFYSPAFLPLQTGHMYQHDHAAVIHTYTCINSNILIPVNHRQQWTHNRSASHSASIVSAPKNRRGPTLCCLLWVPLY